jgi:type I restriction enzyme S subunit
MKPIFENIAIGSTIKTIGLPYFKKLTIPIPPIEEQIRIAEILNSQEDAIEALNNKLRNLENLKRALMQDLLTGKVRVPVN